jgi:hypothetical protein
MRRLMKNEKKIYEEQNNYKKRGEGVQCNAIK